MNNAHCGKLSAGGFSRHVAYDTLHPSETFAADAGEVPSFGYGRYILQLSKRSFNAPFS